ncbi:extracellular solute-binding protein [Spongorhabdus nitratireducens]
MITFIPVLRGILLTAVFLALNTALAGSDETSKVQTFSALAHFGAPKYPDGFTHFDYVNPDAPKGGHLKRNSFGNFDSLNRYLAKGKLPPDLDLLYDTLMVRSADEPLSVYPLLAKRVEMVPGGHWITFHLDPRARFHSGHPVTSKDVAFTAELFSQQATSFYQELLHDVTKVETPSEHTVTFFFKPDSDSKIAIQLAQLPILEARFWQDREFSRTSLTPHSGSGPYRIKKIDAGKRIVYERVKDYWAKDLPVNRGRYNFDLITWDVYNEPEVALQAFLTGHYNFRHESSTKRWETGYPKDLEAAGLHKSEIRFLSPRGMLGFVFNTRQPKFQDRRVREAIALLFDFNWSNTHLFGGSYTRSNSWFNNSDFAATGMPDEEELKLLRPLQQHLPPVLFEKPFQAPETDGSGNIRPQILQALELLKAAGWELKEGVMTHRETGDALKFALLYLTQEFERILQQYRKNLARIGIHMDIQKVDIAHYMRDIRRLDFDMCGWYFYMHNLPGGIDLNVQWHSSTANQPATRNLPGINNPAVDALLAKVATANSYDQLRTTLRALDRVLLWEYYVVPRWYNPIARITWHNELIPPRFVPLYTSPDLTLWWSREAEGDSGKASTARLH